MRKVDDTTPDTFARMALWRATGGAIEEAPDEAAAGDDGLTAGVPSIDIAFCPRAGGQLQAGAYTRSFCPVRAPELRPAA